jgi:predicted transcriptional regulator
MPMFKIIHKFFSILGMSLGGAEGCIKAECENYCGSSPSQALMFIMSNHERK